MYTEVLLRDYISKKTKRSVESVIPTAYPMNNIWVRYEYYEGEELKKGTIVISVFDLIGYVYHTLINEAL